MDVVCYFASGSQAKGCKISAILVKGHKELLNCEQIVTRKREKSVSISIALPEGEYKLLVYDVEAVSNDELPNPAFLTHITVENSSVTGTYIGSIKLSSSAAATKEDTWFDMCCILRIGIV